MFNNFISFKIGKVATGKVRYLLNIVFNTWWFKSALFRYFTPLKKKKINRNSS